ncbi:hypothetical protein RRG08_040873 [Elysia crispata]|uniref:Uncharacterized protein n=1 Tax=Elysia crispata TaxID=231223 RepID=A0AAE1E734_9GAST|nr:hypothetical protein RRG08_040873 [Elysia crispata]
MIYSKLLTPRRHYSVYPINLSVRIKLMAILSRDLFLPPLLGAHGLTSLPAKDLSTSPSEIDPGQEASERVCRSAVCPLHPWPRAVAKTVGKLETDRALGLALAAAQFILK